MKNHIETMRLALEALEWSWGGEPLGTKEFEAIAALRQALDHVPDTMKMLEPDMGIDRGAWDDVPDATKWVDELRGGDETEQEPVAWISADTLKLDHIIKATIQVCRREPDEYYNVPLYTSPPSKPDDLLRQSEQEGWRWAKECEAEVKRLRTLLAKDEPFEYWSVADGWVTVEPEEVIDGRATRKMMLTAMKQTDPQYRDDPECMFAMGWDAAFNSQTRGGNTAPPSKQEQGCGECGVKASDGYALYCVKCVEPMFKKD